MMKLFLSRVENWLLIIPAILLVIEELFFKGSLFDLHFHDTYIVIGGFYIGTAILLFC